MVTLISHNAADTRRVGESWGGQAQAGWVIGLAGELGAGKTQLVKGLALGLGIGARVHSPTYALVQAYGGGRLPLFHLDLFRLETPAQVESAGLDEYLFAPAGVTVIEWFDRWPGRLLGPPCGAGAAAQSLEVLRQVWIEVLGGDDRRIRYEDARP